MVAYGLRTTGEVHTYRERLCQRVCFPECNTDLVVGSLASHRRVQYGVARVNPRDPLLHPPKNPST